MDEVNQAAVSELALGKLSEDELAAAMRFCETCEDGEGYDVPKPMMKRLAELGLVVYCHFGRYAGTPLLDRLQEEHESVRLQGAPIVPGFCCRHGRS